MFAVLISGQLPMLSSQASVAPSDQPKPQAPWVEQVDATHLVFHLAPPPSTSSVDTSAMLGTASAPAPSDTHHVTVFMTGEQAFPDGFAATVHFQTATASQGSAAGDAAAEWKMLGCIKNERPSAIYRVKGLGESTTRQASIGISVETNDSVDGQMQVFKQQQQQQQSQQASTSSDSSNNSGQLVRAGAGNGVIDVGLALALAPKIANNIFSFLSSFAPDSAPQTVPLLQKWLDQFTRKLKNQGSAFLERQE